MIGEAMCCFCGESLPYEAGAILTVQRSPGREESQSFCAHLRCLEERLHPEMRPYLLSDDDYSGSHNLCQCRQPASAGFVGSARGL
jgi:hypothetical protein